MAHTPLISLVGIPLDENSSYLRGPAHGPPAIRDALNSPSSNLGTEIGIDLDSDSRWRDAGDVGTADRQPTFDQIEDRVTEIIDGGERVVSLGGDHSISIPLVRAHAAAHDKLTILHLDAHPDLYDELDGSRISHGCPFARVMEEGLAARLVSVGIRTATAHLREQAARFGVETFAPGDDVKAMLASLTPPLYLSLDLDVLDPCHAPGISHYEPGGLSTRDVLEIIHSIPIALTGADVVELNPVRDIHGMTAMVAAKLVKEIVAQMLGC